MTVHFDDNEATHAGTLPATDQVRLGTHSQSLRQGYVLHIASTFNR